MPMPIIIPCFTCFGDQDPVRDGIAGELQTKVGELFSLLWDWTLGWPTNLVLLGRNWEVLRREARELNEMRVDVRRSANCEAAWPRMEQTRQVEGWLEEARLLENRVGAFRNSYDRQSVWVAGFCLGHAAAELLRQVRDLKTRGGGFNVLSRVGEATLDAAVLAWEMEELVAARDDLLREVEVQEAGDPRKKRTARVSLWLERAVAVIQIQRPPEPGSSPSDMSDFLDILRQIRDVKKQRGDIGGELVTLAPPDAIQAIPTSTSASAVVGGVRTLEEIRAHIGGDDVGLIGVYGMGGIGKTTLLKVLHGELLRSGRGRFDVVIWATVSGEKSILKLQRDIAARLGVAFPIDGPSSSYQIEEQAVTLFRALSRKKFLMFLDDLWEPLDLEYIGIPTPDNENRCKIVFATRSLTVCIDMDAGAKVKVNLLDDVDSWELFRRKMGGQSILEDPSIRPLAEEVVAACGGLPLALVTVGRAMANRRLPNEWDHAIKALRDNASEVRGMEEKVLSALKFSYDRLGNDLLRSCLLFCCLFLEDFNIDRDTLIEYWIGEGFLDDDHGDIDTVDDVRNRGHVLITDLQAACLLESGDGDELKQVKLHDSVRDMLLWLTNGRYDKRNKFVVLAGKDLKEVPPQTSSKWGEATRISLMGNYMEAFPKLPDCPNLLTLLINNNILERQLPEGFFELTPSLCVLDLSLTYVEELPDEIGLLANLRYLNLSWSNIRSLPKGLGNLSKLRSLGLEGTGDLERIPREAILTLSTLQILNLFYISQWSLETSDYDSNKQGEVCLGDLEGLKHLEDLRLDIKSSHFLEKFLNSDALSNCTRILRLIATDLTPILLLQAFKKLKKLTELQIRECPQLEELVFIEGQLESLEVLQMWDLHRATICHQSEAVMGSWEPQEEGVIFRRLRQLHIIDCHALRDIAWVKQHPCLEWIELCDCDGMEELLTTRVGSELISHSGESHLLPKLRRIDLNGLPRLRSISTCQLLLPSLERLTVLSCPKLERLPLGLHCASNLKRIYGAQEWWDGLVWEQDDTKYAFAHIFEIWDQSEADGDKHGHVVETDE